MSDRDNVINQYDYTGGLNTFYPEFQVLENQATDLQNINLFDRGFEKRRGDTAFNSSAMVSASTAVVGLAYMKFNSGTEFLNAVAGTKFFTSSSLSGTMADKTGALAITSGQNNFWTAVSFNNLQIWFGGAPDAPFRHDGSGSDAAALGGSPPSAATSFVANNRVFALSTAADPSRIYWSVLSNPQDWTGSGSGNADIEKNDGEALQVGIPIGSNTAILFKNSSTHKMYLDSAPFPTRLIQKGTGIAGRYAWAVADGVIYFITPGKRMRATLDGANFTEFPDHINDVWDSINNSRVPYIQGIYYAKLEQIHWYVSTDSATTNHLCIIWDLKHKCWLRHTTGFDVNVPAIVQMRDLYAGQYAGKIFKKDVASTYTDASETSPGAIDAYRQSYWTPPKGASSIIQPRWIEHILEGQVSGNFDISYGFDYSPNQKTESQNTQAPGDLLDNTFVLDVSLLGGQTSVSRRTFVYGRGNVFQYKVRNSNAGEAFVYQGGSLYLRPNDARKMFTVT